MPFTIGIIAVCVVAFLAELATGAELFRGGGDVYRDFAMVPVFVGEGEPYRIITSGFLHSGIWHLGLNMLALYFLGSLLETGVGAARFVGIYVVSLLGGSLGITLIEPEVAAVGASGAVFGLMGAAFLIARERGLDEIASQIGFIVVLNLVFTFSIPGISIGAHIGGLVTGGICAFMLRAAREHGGANRQAIEIAGFVALAAIAVIGCIVLAPDPASLFG